MSSCENTDNLTPDFPGFPIATIQKEVYLGHNANSNAYCTPRSIQKLSGVLPTVYVIVSGFF